MKSIAEVQFLCALKWPHYQEYSSKKISPYWPPIFVFLFQKICFSSMPSQVAIKHYGLHTLRNTEIPESLCTNACRICNSKPIEFPALNRGVMRGPYSNPISSVMKNHCFP